MMRWLVSLVALAMACNANSGEQAVARFDAKAEIEAAVAQIGAVEATVGDVVAKAGVVETQLGDVTSQIGDVDARIGQVTAQLAGEISGLKLQLQDQSTRLSEVKQQALVASSKIDNSTSDKVVNRVLVIGVVAALIMLVLTYPIGKLLWNVGGKVRRSCSR